MKNVFKGIKRYLYLYSIFVKNCVIKQMEYRTNFILMILIETAFLLVKLLYTIVVYNTGVKINGVASDSILLFTGSYLIATGIYMSAFYFNFSSIQQYVGDGSLDMFITKPVSLQFITTLRNMDFGTAIPNIVGGITILIVGWSRSNVPVTFSNIAAYIGFLLSGVIVTYAVMLAPQLLCFWIIKGNALREITDSLWDFNTMPMVIYSKWIQKVGVFIFPILLVSNFSPLYILGKLSRIEIIWACVAPIFFFLLVRWLWCFSVKNYSSASS